MRFRSRWSGWAPSPCVRTSNSGDGEAGRLGRDENDATGTPLPKKLGTPHGGLWIAWPKRAPKVPTVVDNKVCAIDEVWSGLRLVIRLSDR